MTTAAPIDIRPATPTDDLPEIEKEISPPDGMAHYARKTVLAIPGEPAVALCGKKWLPNVKDPNEAAKRKICPPCKELMEMLEMMHS